MTQHISHISLPIYLQKFIIKKICCVINYNFGLMNIKSIDYRINETCFKKLTLALSQVCWNWFETVSNNLFISFDLNFNQSKYSIIKIDNIQWIKFHFDHTMNEFYSLVIGNNNKDEITKIETNSIIECIDSTLQVSPLERILIRNVGIDKSEEFTEMLKLLPPCLNRNLKISLNQIMLDENSDLQSITKTIEHFHSLNLLIIDGCSSYDLILLVFQTYIQSIKELVISTTLMPPSFWNILYQPSSPINYLNNLTSISISNSVILTIDQIQMLLSPSIGSSLEFISFKICFDNLIYFLSNENDHIKRCTNGTCESVCNVNESNNQFDLKWNNLLNSLKSNNSKIQTLYLYTECISKEGYVGVCNYVDDLPGSFLTKFSEFISLFSNLNVFCSNILNLKYYQEIISRSNSMANIIVKVPRYKRDLTEFISVIQQHINNDTSPQIKEFTIEYYGNINKEIYNYINNKNKN